MSLLLEANVYKYKINVKIFILFHNMSHYNVLAIIKKSNTKTK